MCRNIFLLKLQKGGVGHLKTGGESEGGGRDECGGRSEEGERPMEVPT